MGLTEGLGRYAARRAHVLVAELPGGWVARVAVEQCLVRRGWRRAESPADADVLVVCGGPGPEMARVLERVWDQMPGPRVRVDVDDPSAIESALDHAATRLADSGVHRDDARRRPSSPSIAADPDRDHVAMDHGGMDHGGMDHGDMEMAPAGIPLAGGGEDRDGLEMDVLHLRLGPVLSHWPAGLMLHCSLQGDVIARAGVTEVDAGHADHGQELGSTPVTSGLVDAAHRSDSAASLLALAGWEGAAAAARKARDSILTTGDRQEAAVALERLHRKVNRSRLLRWSLRGIRSLTDDDLRHHNLPSRLRGDTHDRLLSMIARGRAQLGDRAQELLDPAPGSSAALAALPHLVTGLDLATARLVVASLDLDPLAMRREAPHG